LVTATLKDANGVTTGATASTTVNFAVDNATICSVAPASQIIATGGTNQTATLSLTGVPGSCTVTASATGLTSGSATATVAAAGPASKLAITSNTCSNTPTTANTAGSTCTITVQVQDAAGNPSFTLHDIALQLNQTGTTTLCNATVTAVSPSAGSATGNPGAGQTSSTTSTVTFTVADSKAETCDAVATSFNLTSTTGTASFTGFGSPATMAVTVTPNPIPANGVATSTIKVCLKDSGGNTVTSATDSLGITRTLTVGTGTNVTNAPVTTVTSANPVSATSGCSSFTVQSTGTTGSDTYTASDNTRTIAGGPYTGVIGAQ